LEIVHFFFTLPPQKMTNPILDTLNDHQKEAVEVLSGPLLILAGAGSGKTKCLTHRIANIIAHGVEGNKILAVTFTNKAANEMKTRIEKLLGMGTRMPTVGTFHAVCVRILRADIEQLACNLNKNFVIFDTADTQSLMKLLLKETGFDEKEIKFRAVLSHISSAKNMLMGAEDYFDEVDMGENRFTKAVKVLFPLYQKRLAEHNALDFDDLLQKTVELFEQCPDVLKKYRKRWNHLLVDEYQDTNFAQYRLVRLLADEHKNLCVIGDDHQSIYSFRGADYTNILNFEKDFPAAKVITLEQNYRSSSNILANANMLIGYNQTGHPKKLWTENEEGEKIQVHELHNEKAEGEFVAEEIRKMKDEGLVNYADCAILYRMNAQSRALEEAFMRRQIPYQIVGGTRFFDRKEIKDIVAYLRLIFNPRDDIAFLRVINVPTRKIGPATIEVVKKYAENYTMSLLEVLGSAEGMEELSDSKKEVLKKFYIQVQALQKVAEKEPISILLDRLIEKIEYVKYLDDGSGEGEARIQNVQELFSVATRYDSADDSLAAFLEGVALISDLDNLNKDADSVTMMTIHASKGLEFPVVFLPGWEEGIFPRSSSQFSAEQLEEERRLGYVAITRSEKKCTILHAQQRMIFGKTEYGSPSKFISELDDACTEHNRIAKMSYSAGSSIYGRRVPDAGLAKAKESILHAPPKNRKEALFGISENETEYQIGTRIRHAEWGEGTIIQIAGDVLSVAFSGRGIQKIVASVAPIEIVSE